jgi:hypothetical protein
LHDRKGADRADQNGKRDERRIVLDADAKCDLEKQMPPLCDRVGKS